MYIGNDSSWMAASTPVTAPFYSTGFSLTTSNAKGRYLKIRRDGQWMMSEYVGVGYHMVKLLVYQS